MKKLPTALSTCASARRRKEGNKEILTIDVVLNPTIDSPSQGAYQNEDEESVVGQRNSS